MFHPACGREHGEYGEYGRQSTIGLEEATEAAFGREIDGIYSPQEDLCASVVKD